MKNLRLSSLLVIGFGVVLTILVIVGAFAIKSEIDMRNNLSALANQRLPAVQSYGELNVERMRIRAQTLEVMTIILPTDQTRSQLAELITERANSWQRIDALLRTIAEQPRDSAELERKYTQLMSAVNDWRAVYQGLDATLARMRDTLDPTQFATLRTQYQGQFNAMLPTSQRMGALLEEMSDYQATNARTAATQAESDATTAITITSALLIAGVLIGLGTGFGIFRSVMGQLGGEPAYANQALTRVAGGDLTIDIEVKRGDRSSLLFALREMVIHLRQIVESISENAELIAAASEELSASAGNIAQASETQSASASAMAASVEEMTVSINHVSESAGEARGMAERSGKASREGKVVIDEVVGGIRDMASSVSSSADVVRQLGERSREIASVVGIIKEVADQTNLLALNAAIEAARAGEQGRGFAVVADEVRKLAERTSSSTQDIATIVDLITSGTEQAVNSMEHQVAAVDVNVERAARAGSAIEQINAASGEVIGAISEISLALGEQSSASNDIAKNVEQIAGMTEENSNAVRETATAANDLSDRAIALQETVRKFKL